MMVVVLFFGFCKVYVGGLWFDIRVLMWEVY